MSAVLSARTLNKEQLRQRDLLIVVVTPCDSYDLSNLDSYSNKNNITECGAVVSFNNYEEYCKTLTSRVLELLEVIHRDNPESITEAANTVDRYIKNVYQELNQLAELGIIYFDRDGRKKRPIVWFDDMIIRMPFPRGSE